jgi:hypothetical protein
MEKPETNQQAVFASFFAGVVMTVILGSVLLLNTEKLIFVDKAEHCVDYVESAEDLQEKLEELREELIEEKGPPGLFDIVYDYWLG